MRYVSYLHKGQPGWGLLDDETVIGLERMAPGLRAAMEAGLLPEAGRLPANAPRLDPGELEYLPPVPEPRRILCVGLNYAEHREETGRKPTQHPVIFVRFPSSITGHDHPLQLPRESVMYDYEGELAVVIGRRGRRIAQRDALAHVAGYSCFMDGTVRDWQSHTQQFTPGKNFDNSGAAGPWLVTADEVGDPHAGLRLLTRLNGEVVQDATTDQMIFTIPVLIEYISSFTTLEPGDIIATGTPGGVGFKRTPPLYMKDGDRVEVEIERVGSLANSVRAESG